MRIFSSPQNSRRASRFAAQINGEKENDKIENNSENEETINEKNMKTYIYSPGDNRLRESMEFESLLLFVCQSINSIKLLVWSLARLPRSGNGLRAEAININQHQYYNHKQLQYAYPRSLKLFPRKFFTFSVRVSGLLGLRRPWKNQGK